MKESTPVTRSMRNACAWLATLLLCGATVAAPHRDAPQLAHIMARGTVRCGSVERPGLAEVDDHGQWRGLLVDVCRALATATLGSAQRIEYVTYESPADFDRIRRHVDDVYFLTGRELMVHDLVGAVVPGPTVFVESDRVMVPASSPVNHASDLNGMGVCFLIGSTAEESLSAQLGYPGQSWFAHAYSEQGEMEDAFAVQRCHAIAAESTTLAHVRLLDAPAKLHGRILAEPLQAFPIVASTPLADGRWSAIVAWTVVTLIDAERPANDWFAGGARAMPVDAALGLRSDWQSRVLAAVGHYGQMFARSLGEDSAYHLERGLNALQAQGGVLLAPFVE